MNKTKDKQRRGISNGSTSELACQLAWKLTNDIMGDRRQDNNQWNQDGSSQFAVVVVARTILSKEISGYKIVRFSLLRVGGGDDKLLCKVKVTGVTRGKLVDELPSWCCSVIDKISPHTRKMAITSAYRSIRQPYGSGTDYGVVDTGIVISRSLRPLLLKDHHDHLFLWSIRRD